MNIKTLQKEVGEWAKKNFGKQPSYRQLLGCMEELGELSHAHLKQEQGIRTNENHSINKIDAIGDLVIYLADYCYRENIDLESAIFDTWKQVKQRDWEKNKETGQVPSPVSNTDGRPNLPSTLEEVVDRIFNSLSTTDKYIIKTGSVIPHFVGMNIRNSFDLWDLKNKNHALYKDCCKYGLIHADDISLIVLGWVQSRVHNESVYDIDSTLKRIWKHWMEQGQGKLLPTAIQGVDEYYLNLYLNLQK